MALRAVTFALPDWFRVGGRRPTYMDYSPSNTVNLPDEWSVTIFDLSAAREEGEGIVIEVRGDRTGAIEVDRR